MHADADAAAGGVLDGEGVVKVFGVVGVYSEDGQIAVIEAAGELGGLDGIRQAGDLALDRSGEGGVEFELAVNSKKLGAGLEGFTQELDEFAGERAAGVVPRIEADNDLVLDRGGGFEAGFGGVFDLHINGVTRIVGDDDELGADLGEAADELGAGALDDALDPAPRLVVAVAAVAAEAGVDTDLDGVAGEGV